MHFPEPLKAKLTKDRKLRVTVKLTEEVLVVRDLTLEEARAFTAQIDALLRESEVQT